MIQFKTLYILILCASLVACAPKKVEIHEALLTVKMSERVNPSNGERYTAADLANMLNTTVAEFCSALEKLDIAIYYASSGTARLKFPKAYKLRCG